MPSYSDSYIRERVSSGKDKNRAATVDKLVAQATQPPPEDDAAAMSRLVQLAGDDSTGGWATNDARNYTRMRLSEIGGPQMEYSEARDGGGLLGSIGGVLKTAAPFAALIPGVGPLAAAGIAAGANSAGSLMQGEGLDLGGSLKDAALSGVGSWALGGQGYKGFGNIPGKLGLGGGGGAAPAVGNATQSMPGVAGAAAGAGGGGGMSLPFGLGKIGFDDVARYAPLVMGGIGAYQASKDMGRANELRERGIKLAEQDYAGREPFRLKALEYASMAPPQREDLSGIFADPGNPYNRVRRTM